MHRKRYITNTVFLFGAGLVAQVIGLFVLPLFIENLGPEMYGLFVISNLLMGYVGLMDFGFTDGLTRQIGRAYGAGDYDELADAVSTGFWLLMIVGLVAGAVIYFGRFLFLDLLHVSGSDRAIASRLVAVTAAFSVFQWPMRLPDTILHATLHIKQKSVVQAAAQIVSSMVMLILVLSSVNVVGIRLGVCVVLVVSWLPQIVLVRRCIPDLKWRPFRFRRETFRSMTGFSLGMFYTKLLSMLAIRADHLIIGTMIGVGAITPYVIASKLFDLVRNYTSKLFGALLPTIFSLDTVQNRHKLQTVLEDGVRCRAILITPIAYTCIIISPSFINKWMGPEYSSCAGWSQLYLLVFFSNFFGISVVIARGIGKLKLCNIYSSLVVLLNVSVSILLVPRYGFGGPIIGTVASNLIIGNILSFPFFCKAVGLDWKKTYFLGMRIVATNFPLAVLLFLIFRVHLLQSWLSIAVLFLCQLIIFYIILFVLFVDDHHTKDLHMFAQACGIDRIKPLHHGFLTLIRCQHFVRRYLNIESTRIA